ncbi:SigF/SigG family RNA polymerase sporulation sigma factor [Anaerostipes sp. MSJ-23]|uniref:SigF/SigG family RNA polymerase sporulation sigma factor n=1 Tax=unclassified Anaerostipes TaxID=2635253 RepID=UPI001C115A5B|nr:SigF/SigG family RNA polymerase sporulation sigma factor [Anaerostipes sp. MSJ-23]MBU5459067.1 SigF/SigG family RNA polymerase sporulation sigma factor [Anaerostipes sp. MSJ-23]
MNDVRELLRLTKEGDEKARETLVLENLGLIWSVVRRFHNRGYEMEDLFQIGSIGLMKAIDKFDLSYDVKFSTYAVPMITGEIKRFLRDDGMIKVSRSLKENAYKIQKAREAFSMEYQREATLDEISEKTNLAREEIVAAMEANKEIESLQRPTYQKDGSEILIMDRLVKEENEEEHVVNHIILEESMKMLTEEEEKLIRFRYFQGKTQQEIAKILKISQVQVSRMEKKVLRKLREQMIGHSDKMC